MRALNRAAFDSMLMAVEVCTVYGCELNADERAFVFSVSERLNMNGINAVILPAESIRLQQMAVKVARK